MNKNLKIGLIVTGVLATLGLGLWVYTNQKKKKNPDWKLLADVKKNRKVVITRND